jgi:hypothetical protein
MGFKKIEEKFRVVVPQPHIGNHVAEAVDELSNKIVSAIKATQTSAAIEKLESAIDKIKFPENKPVSYKITVTDRDKDGRISEIIARPIIGNI